ncbi:unnamed protein product [Schistosoma haematobium]|nr:unnamed protein product [Schistosoma haematobium]CAH8524019.1 unnamed protein product [Schistosoma haematobium]
MNKYIIILLITSLIHTTINGIQLINKQYRIETIQNISSADYTLIHLRNNQPTIKCSFCKMIVNAIRKMMTKLSTFQMIHLIIHEMCSVVEDHTVECYDVASQIIDAYVIIFNRTEALDTCMQVSFCS